MENIAWTVGWDWLNYASFPWSHFTKAVFQHIEATAQGGIHPGYEGYVFSDARIAEFVSVCHSHNVKAIVDVWGTGEFLTAITSARSAFVSNLAAWIESHGFDGVSFDLEAGTGGSASELASFITALRDRLGSGKVITVVGIAAGPGYQNGGAPPNIASSALSAIDFISLMTYDYWVDPSCGTVTSLQNTINAWAAAGWPKSKLYIGIPFFVRSTFTYNYWMDWSAFYNQYHPALSENSRVVGGETIYWNNAGDIAAKIAWAKQQGLGGVWDYMINSDTLDPATSLETALFTALGGITPPPPPPPPPPVTIEANAALLLAYIGLGLWIGLRRK